MLAWLKTLFNYFKLSDNNLAKKAYNKANNSHSKAVTTHTNEALRKVNQAASKGSLSTTYAPWYCVLDTPTAEAVCKKLNVYGFVTKITPIKVVVGDAWVKPFTVNVIGIDINWKPKNVNK